MVQCFQLKDKGFKYKSHLSKGMKFCPDCGKKLSLIQINEENEKKAFIGSLNISLKSMEEHKSEIRKIFNELITKFGNLQNILHCINLV